MDFWHWEVEEFADALALRSLRAVPGVWLLLWEQAENIRTHTQLYRATLESIHKVWVPPAEWAELEVPLEAAVRCGAVIFVDDRGANKAWLQYKHTWTFWPGLKESDVCTLLLNKSILGLPAWVRAGHEGIGDVRPACLCPLVKSLCFLDSGVRRCSKAGHSCMRRVIGCSSTPHTMAWRSGGNVFGSRQRCLDSFHPRVLVVRTVAPE